MLAFLRAQSRSGAVTLRVSKVLPAQSQITFSIKERGVPVAGKLARWSADIAFDPKRPEIGEVAFTIATASATFGEPETDAEAPKTGGVGRWKT